MNIATELSFSERARRVFPGGSLGEYNLPTDLVTVLESGQGCRVTNAEGRQFLDMTMGWGSLILGHAHPRVVESVQQRVALGSNFAYVNRAALELAEEMTRAIPCAEKTRFCASGTESTMYMIRLARAFTGRSKIIKFEGAYHGANETGVMRLFPRELHNFPTAEPTSAGILPAVAEHTLIAPYNDVETTRGILETHHSDVAAILVEPLHRCTTPKEGFLEELRALCRLHGILLLFDEVVTGFRLAYGGAQLYYGVTPDLAAYGKGLGGGYPIGAIAGRADVLDLVDECRLHEEQYVWFASSVGGNPVSMTASLATLTELRVPGTYDRLFELGERARSGLRSVLRDCQLEAQVLGDGPLLAVSFTDEPIVDYRSASRANSERARAFTLGLFRRGVFLNPMSTKLYLSLAHQESDIDEFLEIAAETLQQDIH